MTNSQHFKKKMLTTKIFLCKAPLKLSRSSIFNVLNNIHLPDTTCVDVFEKQFIHIQLKTTWLFIKFTIMMESN